MFVLARYLSYRELSTKKSKERQGASLSVRFSEVFESICLIESQLKEVTKGREPLLVFVLARYLSYRESTNRSNEKPGPALGVCFIKVSV